MRKNITDSFVDIIQDLCSELVIGDHSISETYSRFAEYYEVNDRHEYASITSFVYSQPDEDCEILLYNLEVILRALKNETDYPHKKKISKLLDHVNLAIIQRKQIEINIHKINRNLFIANENSQELKRLGEQTKEKLDEVEMKSKEIERNRTVSEQKLREMEEVIWGTEMSVKDQKMKVDAQLDKINLIEKRSSRIYAEFVAILGIFSTIIFAAFGGLEILKNILGNIGSVHTGKLLVFSSLTISAIIVLVFILLNGISKLTQLSLRSCKCKQDEDVCKCNFAQKHPTMVLSHIVILFLFFAGVSAYFIDYRQAFQDIMSTWSSIMTLGVVSIISIFFFVISLLTFRKYYKREIDV